MDVAMAQDMPDLPAEMQVETFRRDGGCSVRLASVQRERTLEVYVDGVHAMRLGCSDGLLAELVVGRLFTEGLVDGVDEIGSLSVCAATMRADVRLCGGGRPLVPSQVEEVPTCCTMNRVMLARPDGPAPLGRIPAHAWDPDWVFSVAAGFSKDSPQHRRTRGTHSCYVARAGEVLFSCEDIGRHNALDKAIGRALMRGEDLGSCMLFTSGRIPTDMAVKAIRAGVLLLASKAAVTDRAVELAREHGLVLVGLATPESFDLLCDPWGMRMKATA